MDPNIVNIDAILLHMHNHLRMIIEVQNCFFMQIYGTKCNILFHMVSQSLLWHK